MTRIFVDASLTASLILADEASDRDPAARAALQTGELAVPAHWPIEIASLLLKHERRGRITAEERDRYIAAIMLLLDGVQIVPAVLSPTIIDLAVATRLTAYDAAYLEQALRTSATLATNDDALIAAAEACGVPVLTTRPKP